MNCPRVSAAIVLLFATSLAMAQDPYAGRWSELRKRIDEGGDVGELLRQWSPPAARATPAFHLTPLLGALRDEVRGAACRAGVRPSLALAIVDRETGFNNRARGDKGEIGAGQIMPATADFFGFDKNRLVADYAYNVASSVAILRYLLDYFGGNEQDTIRGYNGGPGWHNADRATLTKIENYAASVSQLRKKYVPVTCG
jgi:soluble lytic murein transglycosylase-like protein